MAQNVQQENIYDRFFSEVNTRLRDLEEKQRLLRDKMLLVTKGLVGEREKTFMEIQELKADVEKLKVDNDRLKEIIVRLGEAVDKSARKEDLKILQGQFDLFRR